MRRPLQLRNLSIALLLGAVLLVGCGSDDAAPEAADSSPSTAVGADEEEVGTSGTTPDLSSLELKTTQIATLSEPTVLRGRSGSDQLYVAERAGLVRSLTVGADGTASVDADPVLDIVSETTSDVERGLLGMTFSEDGSTLYISHTNLDGNSRVLAYDMDGDVADPDSRRELLAVEQPFPNHNGGNLVLGPDGFLWFGLGDGGAADDPDNRAQNPTNPLGKMLRIDPDAASAEDADIWALGLRNPWRFSFDRENGDLWIADVGQGAIEELNWVPADSEPGLNFGWSGYEGSELYKADRAPDVSVTPVFESTHADGWCSITGGVVYRGTEIPDLEGVYLFGDYCKVGLHGLTLAEGEVVDEQELGPEISQLVSINEDTAGEVYLLSLEGGIYRLEAA